MGSGNYNAWKSYWANLEITPSDLNQLANYLFEKEEPLSIDGLIQVLTDNRLKEREAEKKSKLDEAGELYLPGKAYEIGTKLRLETRFRDLKSSGAKHSSRRLYSD